MQLFRKCRPLVPFAAAWLILHLTNVAAQDVEDINGEPWYPRTVTSENGSAIIYAPQIDSWVDFEKITAWVAFEIARINSEQRYVGSLQFAAESDTDIAALEVLLHDFEILELAIDGLADNAPEYQLIRDAFTSRSRRLPLDLVLEYLPREITLSSTDGLGVSAPKIIVSKTPAILLSVDTEPVILPVDGTALNFLLNTPWDVIRDGGNGPFYLCYEDMWLTAERLDAEWTWAQSLPADFARLPTTSNWQSTRDCLPANLQRLKSPDETPPRVFYTTVPTELIVFQGEPDWVAIDGAQLAYAGNTEQEVFRASETIYLLLSGRWFSSDSLDGPWVHERSLPDSFQQIPDINADPPHAKSYVRASIPGTREAWEAALLASIPRKAEVQRGSEADLGVVVGYAGEPRFVPVEGTEIDLAVNTSYQVLRYQGVYYLCYNATWLTALSATGPWIFADAIPDQFARIPPTSPAYNTTFVRIEGASADSVSYAYQPGYEQAYVVDDTVVYGTGYPTSAVTIAIAYGVYSGYPYPYYWWPPTYGYGSWYDPATGRYGEAAVGYGPFGAAGGAAVYNPETGVYGRGQAVWDSDEFAGRGYVYNPNTNTSMARNRYIDFEDNEGWSQRVARRGDEWRYTESEWQDGRMLTEFESSRGTEGTVYRERQGDSVVSEGTVTRGDKSASFESTRQREGDVLFSEGVIAGEERSASYESVISDGRMTGSIDGSEGGSGSINRELQNGEITGSGSFTRSGKTIETDVTRDADGVTREFSSSDGGEAITRRSGGDTGFVAQSGSGDVYAGRDGQVYQKTDDGWSQVQNPASKSASSAAAAGSSERADISGERFDRNDSLERDYQSRQRGFGRFNDFKSSDSWATQRSRGSRGRRPR